MDSLDKVFAALQTAVRKKRKVRLIYDSLHDKKQIDLILHPYHLMYNNRAWYIVGYSELHGQTRTFKLNRIKQLQTTDKCFIMENKFDINEYLGNAWSMIPQGRLYNIRLKFSKMVAKNVSEVRWHKTQQTKFNPDGTVEMSFRVDGLSEISWWILGYGDQVEVLAPAALRKKIAETAKKVAKINN